MWKAVLQFEGKSLPVKFYSAVQAQGVHFRLLHASDNVPVSQHMVDAETGDDVPRESVQKGYAMEEGLYVVLKPQDLAKTEPPASRDVAISTFLPNHAIAAPWFHRPYYLGPDGAEDAYFALVTALAETQTMGLAHWVMRKRNYHGAVISHAGVLMVITLRTADEVLAVGDLEIDNEKALDAKEIKLAEQLISALQGPFEPETYRDEYRERVMKLVQSKAEGKATPPVRAKPKHSPTSLEAALRSSVKAAKENKVA